MIIQNSFLWKNKENGNTFWLKKRPLSRGILERVCYIPVIDNTFILLSFIKSDPKSQSPFFQIHITPSQRMLLGSILVCWNIEFHLEGICSPANYRAVL